jgi:hypothetical protein
MGNLSHRYMNHTQKFTSQGNSYASQRQQPSVQQSMMAQQQQQMPQQPLFSVQPPPYDSRQSNSQYRPNLYPPSYPNDSLMPNNVRPSAISMPNDQNAFALDNNFLSTLTGWSNQDIERLRGEFQTYANMRGVIDRDGFRKLYIASLLNTTWDAIERNSDVAFRNFDINRTGVLDFNEYIIACSRMSNDSNSSLPPAMTGPSMNSSYTY